MSYRLLLTFYILVLLYFTASAQSTTNHLNYYKLHGKVKTFKQTQLIYQTQLDEFGQQLPDGMFRKLPHTRTNYEINRFNKSGFLLESKDANKSETYEYYEVSNRLRSKKVNHSGKLLTWHTYTYNNNGNLINETSHAYDGVMLQGISYKYNGEGNLIKRVNYGENGEHRTWVKYLYDEKGNVSEKYNYYEESELTIYFATKFTYGLTGKLTSETDSIPYDKNLSRTTYTYDAKGNLAERKEFSRDNDKTLIHTRTYKYIYDTKGNLIEQKEFGQDNDKVLIHTHTYKYRYDVQNNLIEENKFTPDGKNILSRTYTYKYDKMNNWVNWTEYKNNKRIHVKKRKLTYYR